MAAPDNTTISFGELRAKQINLRLDSLLCCVEDITTPLRHPRERGWEAQP
jgi:hypothetical protein